MICTARKPGFFVSRGKGKALGRAGVPGMPDPAGRCHVGGDAFFLEVHEDPEQGLSDGPNMLYLDVVEELMSEVMGIRKAAGLG